MKKCPKCGNEYFSCRADVYGEVVYSCTLYKDGSINTEQVEKEYCGDTDWDLSVDCVACGTKINRETGEVIDHQLRPFTVLLLYPDYIAGDAFGQETYRAHVYAENALQACANAQEQVRRDEDLLSEAFDPKDFYPLFTLRGHHGDLTERG